MLHSSRLAKFRALVQEHRSASHPLFRHLLDLAKANLLTPEVYRLFAVNLAARTMLTLPEIHASCIQAALDLDRVRTAFGVLTGAEEGGFGRPDEVHTKLMMDALNSHGRVAFGLAPIDLKVIMAATRLIHATQQLKVIEDLVGVEQHPAVDAKLRHTGIINVDGVRGLCARFSKLCGLVPVGALRARGEAAELSVRARRFLEGEGVLPETIDYCLAQFCVLTDPRAGYVQGVGFAHEGLADGMIFNIFLVVHAARSRYASENEFMGLVYPYFRAHGDYLAILSGAATEGGVEVVHAQREYAKLEELDDEALENAWQGANDFANRNARVWDGIGQAIAV